MILRNLALTAALAMTGCNQEACNPNNENAKTSAAARETASRVRDTVPETSPQAALQFIITAYLEQPTFSGERFLSAVFGVKDVNFELFDNGKLYFVVKADNFNDADIAKLAIDPKRVQFGKSQSNPTKFSGNDVTLNGVELKKDGFFLFAIDVSNLNVSPEKTYSFPYRGATYLITGSELVAYAENRNTKNGHTNAIVGTDESGVNTIMISHLPYVTEGKEESLSRLYKDLTKGINKSDKERIAQVLLDFVTKQIRYSESEAGAGIETMKKANETLFTGEGDCSNKVILYASLLEQAGIEYQLFYYEGHIAVAVNGNFSTNNGYSLYINKKPYTIAETTVPGFQIGHSKVHTDLSLTALKYLQDREKGSKILDKKRQPLPWK